MSTCVRAHAHFYELSREDKEGEFNGASQGEVPEFPLI